jgi:Fic family protein
LKPNAFTAPAAGRIITRNGYHAFVPAPLPPVLHYDGEMVLALSRADSALSELSGWGGNLPNPHLLIAPYMRREAVLSSRIEGTRASLSDLLLDELSTGQSSEDQEDVREVRNYVSALEHGLGRLAQGFPLSLRLVREIHERLMVGVRGDRATPGAFRRSQNWIGAGNSTPTTAEYVPPPVEEMHGALDAWERFLHERHDIPDLIQCGLMHEQFEAIHPFLDGNGRIGRLLVTLFLVERRRLAQPLLYLSVYIEAHRQEYYDLLQRVRTEGDWRSWLIFFLRGIAETATTGVVQARTLMELREGYRAQLWDKPRALRLIDELFINPYITIARAERLLEVARLTARRDVLLLKDTGVLERVPDSPWGSLYVARPILEAVENPPPP